MEGVNDESVLFTKSSRSLDTHPLRAFIMTSICSFITCISTIIGGGVASMRDERIRFYRSGLLGALLPFGLSGSLVRNCLPGCPLERFVMHLSDIAVLPDCGSIS